MKAIRGMREKKTRDDNFLCRQTSPVLLNNQLNSHWYLSSILPIHLCHPLGRGIPCIALLSDVEEMQVSQGCLSPCDSAKALDIPNTHLVRAPATLFQSCSYSMLTVHQALHWALYMDALL